MAHVLDRIQKLVRLATNNPNTSEAHAAALKAVRLIVEHHIVLSVPGAPPVRQEWHYTPTPQEYDDIWRMAYNRRPPPSAPPHPKPRPAQRSRTRLVSPFRYWTVADAADVFATDRRDIARLFFHHWRPPQAARTTTTTTT